MDFTITSNKGTWGLMHINGIMITKPFISQGNFKRLRGPVGRAHDVHVGYIFLNSDEEIVVRNPKSKIFFYYYYSLLSCLLCMSLQFIHISHLSKSLKHHPVSSWLPRHEDCILRVSFDARYRRSACPLYYLIMVQVVHHSWHLLHVLRSNTDPI